MAESQLTILQSVINEEIENPSLLGGDDRLDKFSRDLDINETIKERIKSAGRAIIRSRRGYKIDEDTIQVINNFLVDKNYLGSKENLRSFVNAMAYLRPYNEPQYHLALVFAGRSLKPMWGSNRGWAWLDIQERENYKPANILLVQLQLCLIKN